MCILFFYIDDEADNNGYRLILASNRDELWTRPTKSSSFWGTSPDCIGGLDEEPGREGGTWLGISKEGKVAALLNIMDILHPDKIGRVGFHAGEVQSIHKGNDPAWLQASFVGNEFTLCWTAFLAAYYFVDHGNECVITEHTTLALECICLLEAFHDVGDLNVSSCALWYTGNKTELKS